MILDLIDYIGNNFLDIFQTIFSIIAIYLAYTAWNTSQEQLKEMKDQFMQNNILQYHLFRYKDMVDAINDHKKLNPEKVKRAVEEGYITQSQADTFSIHEEQFNKRRRESMEYIVKNYEKSKKKM